MAQPCNKTSARSRALRSAWCAGPSLPDEVAAKLAGSLAHLELSERELQVLDQMALGKSNKEIGQHLYISEYTVKNHVKSVLKKLNAFGRTEAIAIAHETRIDQNALVGLATAFARGRSDGGLPGGLLTSFACR
jgi:DNA-binding NarL/FixJ family response regulator